MVFFNRLFGRGEKTLFERQKRAAERRGIPDHILNELRRRPKGSDRTDLVQRLVNLRKLQEQNRLRDSRTFRGIPVGELNKILDRNRRFK